MTTRDAKTAEFARLFDLFDRLASRRSPTTKDVVTVPSTENLRSFPVPPDLASIVESLAGVVGTRTQRLSSRVGTTKRSGASANANDARNDSQVDKSQRIEDPHRLAHHDTRTRARRNTVASSICGLGSAQSQHDRGLVHPDHDEKGEEEDDDGDDVESMKDFLMGNKKNKYPFTFKMMLHKLYELDEWASKVKEVLERSKSEFKPLAEKDGKEGDDEVREQRKEEGRVRFAMVAERAETRGGRRGSVPNISRRSTSIAGLFKGKEVAVMATCGIAPHRLEERRAVKKRCVGRRKSINSLSTAAGSQWVYDGATCAVEEGPGLYAGLESYKLGTGADIPWVASVKDASTEDRLSSRRRALSVADIASVEETQNRKMKRRLAV